ncbi:tripartite tricarboxylate transporter TctB family protein [Amorphus coralli]|uniref:tripartite tricarboxylate transporter TctB family protein n=1 Tax=Amorphus coralli TaxID=340680 RepID=UPI0003789037|nr:tripartite tricarboxylate transporter TctB family protein [Amorphus coralli]
MRIPRAPLTVGLAAAAVAGVGLLGMWEASTYSFGTARMFGPAVFPFALSVLLLMAAAGIVLEGGTEQDEQPIRITRARALVFVTVLGGPVAFALIVGRLGLVPAVFACVLVSALAERSLTPFGALALGAVLAAGCTAVFFYFLNLPLRPFIW